MVVFGVGKHERRVFKTWVERAVPSVVFEISSANTFRNDLAEKFDTYASLGVPEYYLFDPTGECLDVPLLGYRLVEGDYQAVRRDPRRRPHQPRPRPAPGSRGVSAPLDRRLDGPADPDARREGQRPIASSRRNSPRRPRRGGDWRTWSPRRPRPGGGWLQNWNGRPRKNRRLSEELENLRKRIGDLGTIDENPRQSGA